MTRRPRGGAPSALAGRVPRYVRRPGVPAGAGGLARAAKLTVAAAASKPSMDSVHRDGRGRCYRQQSIRRLASRARPTAQGESLVPLRECDVHESSNSPSKSVVGGPARSHIDRCVPARNRHAEWARKTVGDTIRSGEPARRSAKPTPNAVRLPGSAASSATRPAPSPSRHGSTELDKQMQ